MTRSKFVEGLIKLSIDSKSGEKSAENTLLDLINGPLTVEWHKIIDNYLAYNHKDESMNQIMHQYYHIVKQAFLLWANKNHKVIFL